jgi:hypothetical protein
MTNYTKAKQVLQSLIQGVDPHNGNELASDTILNRVDVVRSLLASIQAIEIVAARDMRRALLPAAVGKEWTEAEEQQLREEFSQKISILEIADIHKRTVRAIEARLHRLGLMTLEQRTTRDSFMGEPS